MLKHGVGPGYKTRASYLGGSDEKVVHGGSAWLNRGSLYVYVSKMVGHEAPEWCPKGCLIQIHAQMKYNRLHLLTKILIFFPCWF